MQVCEKGSENIRFRMIDFKTLQRIIDGNNLRVRKTGNGQTTNYLYDGLSVVFETDGTTGAITKTYNPGISATDKKTGYKFFYLYDGLGSVVNLIDKKGQIIQSYSYDAFGQALGVTKDPMNNYRFVGSYGVFSDDDVQAQYMMNRWYDSKLGSFLSRDATPMGELNLYRYASNNGVNLIDPYGLYDWWQGGWGVEGVIGGGAGIVAAIAAIPATGGLSLVGAAILTGAIAGGGVTTAVGAVNVIAAGTDQAGSIIDPVGQITNALVGQNIGGDIVTAQELQDAYKIVMGENPAEKIEGAADLVQKVIEKIKEKRNKKKQCQK